MPKRVINDFKEDRVGGPARVTMDEQDVSRQGWTEIMSRRYKGRSQDFISIEAKGSAGARLLLVRDRMVGRGMWRAREREIIY